MLRKEVSLGPTTGQDRNLELNTYEVLLLTNHQLDLLVPHQSLTNSFTNLLTYTFTYSLTYSFPYSLTNQLLNQVKYAMKS